LEKRKNNVGTKKQKLIGDVKGGATGRLNGKGKKASVEGKFTSAWGRKIYVSTMCLGGVLGFFLLVVFFLWRCKLIGWGTVERGEVKHKV